MLSAVEPSAAFVDDEPISVAISGEGLFETGEIRVRFGEAPTPTNVPTTACSSGIQPHVQVNGGAAKSAMKGNANNPETSAEAQVPPLRHHANNMGNIVPASFDEETQTVCCVAHRAVFDSLFGSSGGPAYSGVSSEHSVNVPVYVALNGEDFVGMPSLTITVKR